MKQPRVLVVASHNAGKVREIFDLLAPLGFAAVGAKELGLSEPEETGTTFAENAALKARLAADATGQLALADDSGLVVFALDGAPGIHSARWAGEERDFGQAIARLEHALALSRTRDPAAKFVCALALAEPGGNVRIFEGEVHGSLCFPARGSQGFGYDPIFVADGMQESFGEIDPARKHAVSHRARAFAQLRADLERPNAPS
jgi:XTP/dITP diphosphohydrolase